MKPKRPPILHRIETRRAGQPLSNPQRFGSRRDDRGEVDLMFWAVVAVAIALAYGILVWGGRDVG